jgi:4-hydroxy-tetrahydrodipicolinate synthase
VHKHAAHKQRVISNRNTTLGTPDHSGFQNSAVVQDKRAATANGLPSATSDYKDWARETFRGVENVVLPSFTPDFSGLDEAGIRHDVRQSHAHGFFSSACCPALTTLAEYKRMAEIVADEARGKMLTSVFIGEPTFEANLELLAHAETVGCSHVILVPRTIEAKSEDEVYAWYRNLIDSTKLPITLYAQNNKRLRHLHPSGIPLQAFAALAELPSVVAIKLTQAISMNRALQCGEALGEKVLMGPVHLDTVPMLAKNYRVQWTGQWNAEAVQSPDKRYVVELMQAAGQKNIDKAVDLYWTIEAAYRPFFELQVPLLLTGGHPWLHMKYHQWCVGGNGGLVRDPRKPLDQVPILTESDRKRIKESFAAIGIAPTQRSEDEFLAGAANHARGVRAADLAVRPLYQ